MSKLLRSLVKTITPDVFIGYMNSYGEVSDQDKIKRVQNQLQALKTLSEAQLLQIWESLKKEIPEYGEMFIVTQVKKIQLGNPSLCLVDWLNYPPSSDQPINYSTFDGVADEHIIAFLERNDNLDELVKQFVDLSLNVQKVVLNEFMEIQKNNKSVKIFETLLQQFNSCQKAPVEKRGRGRKSEFSVPKPSITKDTAKLDEKSFRPVKVLQTAKEIAALGEIDRVELATYIKFQLGNNFYLVEEAIANRHPQFLKQILASLK